MALQLGACSTLQPGAMASRPLAAEVAAPGRGCATALPARRRRQRPGRPACSTAAATGLNSNGGSREAARKRGGRQVGSDRLQASSVDVQQRPQTAAQPPSGSSSSGSSASNSTARLGSSSSSRPSGSSSSSGAAPRCRVRPAEPGDYWAIADLHCMAFYPRATFFWFAALRLDRVMSLQLGKERQQDGVGRFACLVADAHDPEASSLSSSGSGSSSGSDSEDAAAAAGASAASSSSSMATMSAVVPPPRSSLPPGLPAPIAATQAAAAAEGRVELGPLVGFLVSTFFPEPMRQNYAASYAGGGLLGAVVIDTMGEFVPPKQRRMPNGTIREVPRHGICYLSNLAVAPCTRRSGVGRRLLAEAEALAASWGCRSMALHVDPSNTAAIQMYTRAGYKKVSDQPECQRIMEQRDTPLALYMRALPWEARQAAKRAAAGQGQGQAGGAVGQQAGGAVRQAR